MRSGGLLDHNRRGPAVVKTQVILSGFEAMASGKRKFARNRGAAIGQGAPNDRARDPVKNHLAVFQNRAAELHAFGPWRDSPAPACGESTPQSRGGPSRGSAGRPA